MATEPDTQNSWNSGYPFENGQLLIGQQNENPIPNTLTADFGIEIDNAPGSITIRATGQTNVEKVTANTQMIEDRNYITDGATKLEITLPAEMALGSVFTITDVNEGFTLLQNAGQTINFGNKSTTTGVDGNIDTIQPNSSITIMCVTADTEFNVISSVGNFRLDIE